MLSVPSQLTVILFDRTDPDVHKTNHSSQFITAWPV